jgi:hypothetical protein
MMTGPGNLAAVRSAVEERLHESVDEVAAPGERLASTAIGWAVQQRNSVPLLFLGRRQYLFALTDRRLLAFARHRGGPQPSDLILGKRYSFFTLDKQRRFHPLYQLRLRGANGSRLVLEFRPGQRAIAAELAARLVPPAGNAWAAGGETTDTSLPAPRAAAMPDATDPDLLPSKKAQKAQRKQAKARAKQERAQAKQAGTRAGPSSEPVAPPHDADDETAIAFWGDD